MISKRNLSLSSYCLIYGWGHSWCHLGGTPVESLPYSFNHLSSLSITVYQGPDMHQACWGVGHKRALFWRLHSNEEKPINVFPKFQSFAYCFQNFGLYAHCPIIVLPLPLAYGWWSHSFIYLRPSAPKCSQKDKLLVYVYIFFHIHEDKPVTLNFKINW